MRQALLLSAAANLILLAIFAVKHFGGSGATVASATPPPVKVLRQTRVETVTNAVEAATVTLPGEHFHWRQLESEDYFQYVGNLRAVGCPERTVEHIIIEDVEKLYREKNREENSEQPLWITGPERDAWQQERRNRKAALLEEKTKLLTALLGKEVSYEGRKTWVNEADAGWFLSFLPGEKAELVLAIGHRLGSQLEATIDASYSFTPEQLVQVEGVYAKMMEEFSRIATPGEIEEGLLRMTLAIGFISGDGPESLRLSGDELRRLVALQYKEEDPFRKILKLTLGEEQRGTVYSPEFIRDARQILGEQRFADFLVATDRELKLLGSGGGAVPSAQVTVKVFEIQQAALQEAEAVRARTDLSRAEKRAELKAIQEMSKAAFLEVADAKGADTYLKRAGWWKELKNP